MIKFIEKDNCKCSNAGNANQVLDVGHVVRMVDNLADKDDDNVRKSSAGKNSF
mgnify:CR=1 FL=1